MKLKHDARKKERSESFFSKKLTQVAYLSISEQEKYLLAGFLFLWLGKQGTVFVLWIKILLKTSLFHVVKFLS